MKVEVRKKEEKVEEIDFSKKQLLTSKDHCKNGLLVYSDGDHKGVLFRGFIIIDEGSRRNENIFTNKEFFKSDFELFTESVILSND